MMTTRFMIKRPMFLQFLKCFDCCWCSLKYITKKNNIPGRNSTTTKGSHWDSVARRHWSPIYDLIDSNIPVSIKFFDFDFDLDFDFGSCLCFSFSLCFSRAILVFVDILRINAFPFVVIAFDGFFVLQSYFVASGSIKRPDLGGSGT